MIMKAYVYMYSRLPGINYDSGLGRRKAGCGFQHEWVTCQFAFVQVGEKEEGAIMAVTSKLEGCCFCKCDLWGFLAGSR